RTAPACAALPLHDALPIYFGVEALPPNAWVQRQPAQAPGILKVQAGIAIQIRLERQRRVVGAHLQWHTAVARGGSEWRYRPIPRSEEHTSELQSRSDLLCR